MQKCRPKEALFYRIENKRFKMGVSTCEEDEWDILKEDEAVVQIKRDRSYLVISREEFERRWRKVES